MTWERRPRAVYDVHRASGAHRGDRVRASGRGMLATRCPSSRGSSCGGGGLGSGGRHDSFPPSSMRRSRSRYRGSSTTTRFRSPATDRSAESIPHTVSRSRYACSYHSIAASTSSRPVWTEAIQMADRYPAARRRFSALSIARASSIRPARAYSCPSSASVIWSPSASPRPASSADTASSWCPVEDSITARTCRTGK